MITLFNELRKQGKLAAKRHPMYDKNRFGKFFMYFMTVFWAGYLMLFGTTFAFSFKDMAPNMEPYHILNSGLIFVLAMDFMTRFPFQKTPTQEVKPYLLLPIKRNRMIDFLLLRSGLSFYNLFWLFFFVPFAVVTVTPFYGVLGVVAYSIGIWLLMLFNNYWYLLCRTLINERIWWVLLPIVVYGVIAAVIFIPEHSSLEYFFMSVGEGYIEANVWVYLGTLVAIALMWFINRMVMARLVYSELNKVEDTKVKHLSEYKFLDQYGEVGEYCRLELKMLLRNKRCKTSLRTIAIIVILFSGLLSFTDVYNGNFMRGFISIYSFVAFGMVILVQIMGFEGNYIDGLMTRKESIYNLLRAKYYVYTIGLLVPFMLMIPAMVMGKFTLLNAFAFAFFSSGVVYFLLFQLAVYNNKTVPLNEGVTGRQASGTGLQNLVASGVLGLPMVMYFTLNAVVGEIASQWTLLIIGLSFTLTSHLWIKNVYNRFMKRRYRNMEGFRDTK